VVSPEVVSVSLVDPPVVSSVVDPVVEGSVVAVESVVEGSVVAVDPVAAVVGVVPLVCVVSAVVEFADVWVVAEGSLSQPAKTTMRGSAQSIENGVVNRIRMEFPLTKS